MSDSGQSFRSDWCSGVLCRAVKDTTRTARTPRRSSPSLPLHCTIVRRSTHLVYHYLQDTVKRPHNTIASRFIRKIDKNSKISLVNCFVHGPSVTCCFTSSHRELPESSDPDPEGDWRHRLPQTAVLYCTSHLLQIVHHCITLSFRGNDPRIMLYLMVKADGRDIDPDYL